MMKKKIAAMLMICCLAFTAAACGADKAEEKGGERESASSLTVPDYETDKKLKASEEIPSCKAESYDMELKLDTEDKKLSGTITVTLINETEDTLSELCFRNYTASMLKEYGKGHSEIKEAFLAGSKEKLPLSVRTDPSLVYADISSCSLKPEEKMTVSLNFETDIPKKKERFGYSIDQDTGTEVFQLSFCFPSLSVYENGAWSESPYLSFGECNYTKMADYRVKLQAPEGYTVAAGGKEETKGETTVIKGENLREMSIVVSNNLKVKTATVQDIAVNLYYFDHKGNDEFNELSLEAAADAVNVFNTLIGPYPYDELDVVQTYYEGAMEYSGLVMIGLPDSQYNYDFDKTAGIETVCSTIAHEVAHQWFYGAVGNDPYLEPWLDESFAEYCQDILYKEFQSGSLDKAATSDQKRFEDANYTSLEEDLALLEERGYRGVISLPRDQYEKNDTYYMVYDYGERFFYELRKAMGDGAFFHTLREYYKAYYLREAKTEDFVNAVKTFDDSAKVQEVLDAYIA